MSAVIRPAWVSHVSLGAAVSLLLLTSGCAIIDNRDFTTDGVQVQATGTHVVMNNGLDERVFYFIVGRKVSFLIDWIPHLDEERSVAPGRSVSVPYDDIMMDHDTGETQVVAYWWKATIRDGKRVPGDTQMVIVDL